jgi:hypothetical protein
MGVDHLCVGVLMVVIVRRVLPAGDSGVVMFVRLALM